MNMNKIHNHWIVSCNASLVAIDRMSASDTLELGLITKEESNVILQLIHQSTSSFSVFSAPHARSMRRAFA